MENGKVNKNAKTVTPDHVPDRNVPPETSNQKANRLTRESLGIALIHLMNMKPFDKITITELVNRAGVSRTAFYRTYTCKEDILREIGDELIARVIALDTVERASHSDFDWCREIFQTIKDHKEAFLLISHAGLTYEMLFNHRSIVDTVYPSSDRDKRYTRLASESGFIKILNTWVEDGMQETPEHMADLCAAILKRIAEI